ncbi:hypothetical protein SEA_DANIELLEIGNACE_59 [Arthrobacter phage DanielleIgnace]|nr:hypothetical protein SEA_DANIELLEIGNACE_59 [Arthrobacter phage DanielleIgnace]
MTVKSGYKIERDENGLTAHERAVLVGIVDGKTLTAIGNEQGLSRQRAAALGKSLLAKGWLHHSETSPGVEGATGRKMKYTVAPAKLNLILAMKGQA